MIRLLLTLFIAALLLAGCGGGSGTDNDNTPIPVGSVLAAK
jgi:hypothetical protein